VVVTFLNAQGMAGTATIDVGEQATDFNADTAITVLLPTSQNRLSIAHSGAAKICSWHNLQPKRKAGGARTHPAPPAQSD